MIEWTFQAGDRSIKFSDSTQGVGLMDFPEIAYDVSGQSYPNPRRDGRRMGVDERHGQVVSLTVEVRPDHRPYREVWRELIAVWRADSIRRSSGALATLTTDEGYTTYGRPRGLSPSQEYRLFDIGRAELVFESTDDLWYGVEESIEIRLAPRAGLGMSIPARVPFDLSRGVAEAETVLEVDGDVDTWAVYTLRGPIRDPWIDVPGVGTLRFSVGLAYDQELTIDTRPWATWIRRNGNALPGALLASGARLSDMALPPGAYPIMFGGSDPTGTSRLEVRVRPAFTSF